MSDCFYLFGPFRIDTRKRRLLRDGEIVPLTSRTFDTLLAFAQNSGRVLDKDDLMQMIWPNTIVEEANLTQNVSVLRKALGDNSGDSKYIVTIPGRGYRFIADVKTLMGEDNFIVERRTRARLVVEDIIESEFQAKTLCVLPFKSFGTKGDEYLGLGIADALITRLGNIKQIVVRPTSAILKYASVSHDPILVGQELRADAVLEGSIQHQGDRLRVTAQLVSVQAQAPIWAGKLDERFTDIFTVEDRISEQIARALMLTLTGEEQRRLTQHHTESARAYQCYLKGVYFANKATAAGALKAIEHFNRAIGYDCEYALAYAAMADAYTWLSHFHISPAEAMPKAREAAVTALELDDTLAEAHYMLALIKMWYDWDLTGAEKRFRRAIELNPNHAMAHTWYGFYLTAMGRFGEAQIESGLAEEIDPLSLVTYGMTGWSLYMMREYERAIEQFGKAVEMDPSFHTARWGLGWCYIWTGQLAESLSQFEQAKVFSGGGAEAIAGLGHACAKAGKIQEAQKLLDELQDLSRQRYISPFYIALLYAGLEDKERTLEYLQKACEHRAEWMIHIKVDPVWDFLHSDNRFVDLQKRIGLH
jgi:DNA-binding winged helix-turn-helix (wHTH) protein/TolB-like protein/Tfp pilus assembly protein PilF